MPVQFFAMPVGISMIGPMPTCPSPRLQSIPQMVSQAVAFAAFFAGGAALFGWPQAAAAQTEVQTPAPPPAAAAPAAAPPVAPYASEAPPSLPPPPVYVPPPAPASAAYKEPALIDFIVPKAISLTAGWSYTPTNSLPLSTQNPVQTPHGINVDAALLWQVRGFDGVRWPAWVGFMTGFLYYFGENGSYDTLGVDYGIYVKHALFPGRRARFFFGYGLGAAQVWIRGLDGRGVGHYTRLSIGADTHLWRWLHLTFEASYRFFNLPTFKFQESDSGGYDFHALCLMLGLWFGR